MKFLEDKFQKDLTLARSHISTDHPIVYMGFKMVIDPLERHDLQFIILKDKNLVYEEEVVSFIKQNQNENITFIDVGANNGFFSLLVASMSPENTVYSFEPSPKAYRRLITNIIQNGFKNIHPFNIALGSKKEDAYLNISNCEDGLNSLKSIKGSGERIPVHVTTLDNFFGSKKVDFVKIDVEGMEEEVIRGASGVISHNKRVKIIFEHNANFIKKGSDNGINFLRDLGLSIDFIEYDHNCLRLNPITEVRNLPRLCNLVASRNLVSSNH
jgi:FkbM family methyltransferase